MAFRIHDSVVRGTIDNRTKGIVRGEVWLAGLPEPMILELKGNAHPDVAGCMLTFTNPGTCVSHPHLESLALAQRGAVGDITAARKTRVFDIPFEKAYSMLKRKEKPPEHIANALYLEWFSESNGRVVIESADYDLTVSAPEWRLTPEEDAQRARNVAEAMDDFLERLTDAIERQKRGQKHPDEGLGTSTMTSASSGSRMRELKNTPSYSRSTETLTKRKRRSRTKWVGTAS